MLQGLLVSLLFSGILFVVFFMGYPYANEFKREFALFIFIPIISIGTLLGLISGSIYENRFRKLFLIGMFFVYLTSLIHASVMILNDKSGLIKGTEIVTSILMLGSTGFLLFGVFTVPAMLLGVFLIELWTHPKY